MRNGVFRPLEPVDLKEGEEVKVIVGKRRLDSRKNSMV
ncbi:MAG: antitoxin family protein [Desulfurococcales archaeon]|nr:antitoxin family protein [Desulfurococcales archaeon]